MKVAVVGGRNYTNKDKLFAKLDQYEIDMIISGGAKGADTLAYEYAIERGIAFVCHPPSLEDKKRYGYARACKRRNLRIVLMAEFVIAFPTEESKGTWHTINLAKRFGVPGIVVQ